MEAGTRVFSDATQSSTCGCKNSIARLLQKDVRRARYLDPKTSRWLSADPALGEYMAGSNAGAGGIYNQVNFNLYHYGNNNPVKYSDPDGKSVLGKVLGYGCYIAAGAVLLAGTAVCSDNCRHNGCCCSSSSSHLGWKINGSRNRYFSD